ncbi:ferredoxin family protein [Striga asiatica]|uniref:Ferredoxin family protein n=1 Tax=Striga asiatica TaxID=4170 RepID=A0A5A7NZM7_STRAF|nr:ferredoxin family protein [Striga asiatica]
MDLQTPCNACIGINRKQAVPGQSFPRRSIKIRRKMISELQMPVAASRAPQPASIPTHKVTVHDRQRGVVHEFLVPEDQYILHTAEDQNITLPFACRHGERNIKAGCCSSICICLTKLVVSHCKSAIPIPNCSTKVENFHDSEQSCSEPGCCTSCAVRVKSGELRQPEALGISAELKSQGYALLCVGFPSSDLEVETQDEDEVYWLQFGRYFARGPIERDDYALELAMGEE